MPIPITDSAMAYFVYWMKHRMMITNSFPEAGFLNSKVRLTFGLCILDTTKAELIRAEQIVD